MDLAEIITTRKKKDIRTKMWNKWYGIQDELEDEGSGGVDEGLEKGGMDESESEESGETAGT